MNTKSNSSWGYKWSHDESNAAGIVILPPNNVDSLTDDEEVQDDDVMIDNGFPSDVCGTVQVQTNFLNGKDNDNEVEDDDDIKEEQTESRAQNGKTHAWSIERCWGMFEQTWKLDGQNSCQESILRTMLNVEDLETFNSVPLSPTNKNVLDYPKCTKQCLGVWGFEKFHLLCR